MSPNGMSSRVVFAGVGAPVPRSMLEDSGQHAQIIYSSVALQERAHILDTSWNLSAHTFGKKESARASKARTQDLRNNNRVGSNPSYIDIRLMQ